jgi:hypothetical protein
MNREYVNVIANTGSTAVCPCPTGTRASGNGGVDTESRQAIGG